MLPKLSEGLPNTEVQIYRITDYEELDRRACLESSSQTLSESDNEEKSAKVLSGNLPMRYWTSLMSIRYRKELSCPFLIFSRFLYHRKIACRA